MYQLSTVDGGYQIFRLIQVKEYPPEEIISPIAGEKVYTSYEEAMAQYEELNNRIQFEVEPGFVQK